MAWYWRSYLGQHWGDRPPFLSLECPAGIVTRVHPTTASENDLRAWVIKRKISGGTMSADRHMAT